MVFVMTREAEPDHVKRLAVVGVVHLGGLGAALLAGLSPELSTGQIYVGVAPGVVPAALLGV